MERGQTVQACATCPAGAVCRVDRVCALRPSSWLRCANGSAVVGNWSLDSGSGRYRLVSCPAGYSRVAWPEDQQECRMCSRVVEYILNPNADSCQGCPAGLVCFGNETVVPRVAGSTWARNGSVYLLTSCPSGFSMVTSIVGNFFDPVTQSCIPVCGSSSTVNVSCGLGFFKLFGYCVPCSSSACLTGEYRSICGAFSDSACLPCTNKPATGTIYTSSGNHNDCTWTCMPSYYQSNGLCLPCNISSCSVGLYRRACGTASNGECVACTNKPPINTVYIAGSDTYNSSNCAWTCVAGTFRNSNTSTCTECTLNITCPPGSRKVNCSLVEDTLCTSCPLGSYDVSDLGLPPSSPTCRNCTSSPCPIGQFRGPCFGRIDAFCSPCSNKPDNSIYLSSGFPFNNDNCSWRCAIGYSRVNDLCKICPPGTYGELGQDVPECRQCGKGSYSTLAGATSSALCVECTAGKFSTTQGAGSPATCINCTAGTYQSSGGSSSCILCMADSYNGREGSDNPGSCIPCDSKSSTVGKLGQASPNACLCKSSYYRIDPNTSDCHVCPQGLNCYGNSSYSVRVQGSLWNIINSTLNLVYCPSGYQMVFSFLPNSPPDQSAQDCVACGKGAECLNPPCRVCTSCNAGYYKDCSSAEPCTPCAKNTYGLVSGAESSSFCLSCPDGTGTSDKIGQKSPLACVCDSAHYVVGDNSTSCLKCPLGLKCFGNQTVVPLLSSSRWNSSSGIQRLQYCPQGYFMDHYSEVDSSNQECVVCPKGSECTEAPCKEECPLCKPGFYKAAQYLNDTDWAIGDPCTPCPANTYRPDPGATDSGSCKLCPVSSITLTLGNSNISDCICTSNSYKTMAPYPNDPERFLCQSCPQGATCSDRNCSVLVGHTLVCFLSNGVAPPILVGNWSRNEKDQYFLNSCPSGYSKITKNSANEFSHDIQTCQKCAAGTNYILDPNNSPCQICPRGLACFGNESYVPIQPPGSRWEIENGGRFGVSGLILMLKTCPSGYEVSNVTHDSQQCLQCAAGYECREIQCVKCSPCRPGTFKALQSIAPCEPCPVNTYNPNNGSSSISECHKCIASSATSDVGQTLKSACVCNSGFYLDPVSAETCFACPQSAVCLPGRPPAFGKLVKIEIVLSGISTDQLCCQTEVLNKILWAISNASGISASDSVVDTSFCFQSNCTASNTTVSRRRIQVQTKLALASVVESKSVGLFSSPKFSASFSALSGFNASFNSSIVSASNTDTEGWVYGPITSSGQYPLIGCPPGSLLINTTVNIAQQTCNQCKAGTYSIDPLDGCERNGVPDCPLSNRVCNKCPVGARCEGRNSFIPTVTGSIWIPIYDSSLTVTQMHLISCPPGILRIRNYCTRTRTR